jgi:hypothetical protein
MFRPKVTMRMCMAVPFCADGTPPTLGSQRPASHRSNVPSANGVTGVSLLLALGVPPHVVREIAGDTCSLLGMCEDKEPYVFEVMVPARCASSSV